MRHLDHAGIRSTQRSAYASRRDVAVPGLHRGRAALRRVALDGLSRAPRPRDGRAGHPEGRQRRPRHARRSRSRGCATSWRSSSRSSPIAWSARSTSRPVGHDAMLVLDGLRRRVARSLPGARPVLARRHARPGDRHRRRAARCPRRRHHPQGHHAQQHRVQRRDRRDPADRLRRRDRVADRAPRLRVAARRSRARCSTWRPSRPGG